MVKLQLLVGRSRSRVRGFLLLGILVVKFVESGKIVAHNLAGKGKLLLIKVTVVEHNSFLLGKSGTEGRKTLESGEDGGWGDCESTGDGIQIPSSLLQK